MPLGYFPLLSVSATLVMLAALPGSTSAQGLNLENSVEIEQEGADNEASIDQTGEINLAGTEAQPIVQNGFDNRLTIRQSGVGNTTVGTAGLAVRQVNTARGPFGTNTAFVEQLGNGNRVDEIQQRNLGATPQRGNRLSLRQINGNDNVIGTVSQIKQSGMLGQSANITMDGTGNRIDVVSQDSRSTLRGEENAIFVLIQGSNNGTTALRGVAQRPLVSASTLSQVGGTEDTLANGNLMNLEILANDTAFGIVQRGRSNRTGAIVITGDGNSLGIDQDGLDNDLSVGLIEGTDNEIGVSQFGTNVAFLDLLGQSDGNSVLIDQMGTNDAAVTVEGDRNILSVVQGYLGGVGGTNVTDLAVVGDANLADLMQEGRDNAIDIQIEGDTNNANIAGFTPQLAAIGFNPGRFEQIGNGNTLAGVVEGDANVLATLQQGSLNAILFDVRGDENEALLRQIGAGNSVQLSQTGRGNVALVLQ
ncbi:Curlin associated repeat-containing protein [Salinihabitans flavidus]|uniref:Curlin associated repeat-containing protein n=1 Tax=Salinihabitans flavidus TaxID=569882 RepID=A0A1H8VED9_9RHOB|nr:hypothetical protein [Salinihabitans flavidus]SEP13755.1 Curlin associated repeat-containing protein [Salinihabitans flavidus]